MLRLLIACVLLVACSAGNWWPFSRKASAGNGRFLLPKPIPHEDDRYLLVFVTSKAELKGFESTMKKVEDELGTKFRVINRTRRKDLEDAYQLCGGNEFFGEPFPYFYNRRTTQIVTGLTSYQNLLQFAVGSTDAELRVMSEAQQAAKERRLRSGKLENSDEEMKERQRKNGEVDYE